MSAKHGAKESAAWTRELDVILLDGIEDNRQGKDLAHERVKALHPLPQGKDRYPRDFEKWLAKVFEKPSEDGAAPWLSLEFWQHEVDKVLIQGIFVRNVAPSGMLSLWTAPGITLTSFNDRAKQSAYSSSSLWMVWRWSLVMSGPIVTSWMILLTRSGLWGLSFRVKRVSGFSFSLGTSAVVT